LEILTKLNIIWESFPVLMEGTLVALELTFIFLGVGVAVGVPVALAQIYGNRVVRVLASIFEQIFRGLPALVLLFLFYFGLTGINMSPLIAATLAMGLRSAAYQSQIFRGAIQSIDAGQELAARSIGMSRYKSIRYIVLPQAVKIAIPPWSNEFTNMVKDTSYVFVVGIVELMRQGRYIVAREFGDALLVYSVIALIYFFLNYAGNHLLGRLARKLAIPGEMAGESAMERI
jgi:polar amino acid transport system permease protein